MIGDECVVETYKKSNGYNCKKCICGSEVGFANMGCHIKQKKHINYMELKKQEIALPLPTIPLEIPDSSIPDNKPEEILEIPASVPDPVLTKAEIRKQKKKDYMRDYMREYHAKRYNEDAEYREYRKQMSRKSTCKMGSRYVKAYQYIKENNIQIFDENGN